MMIRQVDLAIAKSNMDASIARHQALVAKFNSQENVIEPETTSSHLPHRKRRSITEDRAILKQQAIAFRKVNHFKHLDWRPDANRYQVSVNTRVMKKHNIRVSLGYVNMEDARIGSEYGSKFQDMARSIVDRDPNKNHYVEIMDLKTMIKKELKQQLKY